ncbi:MAG: 9-O-acetylesterase, partial [Planctomycetota bacterium]
MTFPRQITATIALLLALTTTPLLHAELRLPGFFGDHMVLQQEKPIKVWGWAEAGEEVTVALSGKTATTKAADNGTWQVEMPAMKASNEAHSLKVTAGEQSVELTDVLIGEVWLCSGQSNMEWSVNRSSNAESEIAAANYPYIRHIKV